MTVSSSDGVCVTVHHLAERPQRPPLLVSHATGFNALAYTPLAGALDGFDVWGHDHRGHGATPAPAQWKARWDGYGDDTAAAAHWIASQSAASPTGLVGVGHSMGAASLLMAADRDPSLFRLLVLYEPIVFPPGSIDADPESSPLVIGARRRRRQFDSFAAAYENFSSKPPLGAFDPAALRGYLTGGLAPVDPAQPAGPVRLTCDPDLEADTFACGHLHDTWERLPSIAVPTVVVAGTADAGGGPAEVAPLVAARLRDCRFVAVDGLDHFGPFTDPAGLAAVVDDALAGLGA